MLAALADLVDEATTAFEGYDYARALERTESFFWTFCDQYLELVKGRAYGVAGPRGRGLGPGRAAARALDPAAPVRPVPPLRHRGGLVVVAGRARSTAPAGPTPTSCATLAGEGDPLVAEVTAWVLGEVRKAKTEAKRTLKTAVERVVVTDTAARLAALGTAILDVHDAGIIGEVDLAELADGAEPSVVVTLAATRPRGLTVDPSRTL